MNPSPRAELLSIGSELLLGETVDTNAAFLGAALAELGLPLASVRMLPDDRAVIRDAFADALTRASLVVATGGLGPTHDDVTREALADALGEELHEDPALLATLEERFRALGPMPPVNRRQVTLIASAEPLPNPIGSAPGWWVERPEFAVATLPGVPSEMRRMWTDELVPRLRGRFGAARLATRTVKAFGLGESAVAQKLAAVLESPPRGVDAGIYARDDGVHVRFSTRQDARALDSCVAATLSALGDDAYGTDGVTLADLALDRLGALGAETVASSESGTGGALLAILADADASARRARYVGGILDAGGAAGPPAADAVIEVSLLPSDANGRSRVRVAVSGAVALPRTELRVHGSGPQRLRRAGFAALDAVRRG